MPDKVENLNDEELARQWRIYDSAARSGQTMPVLDATETARLNQCKAAAGREVLRGYVATGHRSSSHALAASEPEHQIDEDLAARNAEKS